MVCVVARGYQTPARPRTMKSLRGWSTGKQKQKSLVPLLLTAQMPEPTANVRDSEHPADSKATMQL